MRIIIIRIFGMEEADQIVFAGKWARTAQEPPNVVWKLGACCGRIRGGLGAGPERFQRPGRDVSLGFDWTF